MQTEKRYVLFFPTQGRGIREIVEQELSKNEGNRALLSEVQQAIVDSTGILGMYIFAESEIPKHEALGELFPYAYRLHESVLYRRDEDVRP